MRHLMVYITASSKEEARRLAEALVGEKLAACANIVDNVESIYWWQGKLERSAEAVCILKTTRENFAALNRRTLELHSYDTPCVVALPLAEGNPDYLAWIDASCINPGANPGAAQNRD